MIQLNLEKLRSKKKVLFRKTLANLAIFTNSEALFRLNSKLKMKRRSSNDFKKSAGPEDNCLLAFALMRPW